MSSVIHVDLSQVRNRLQSEVLQQLAWHPVWSQIHHLSLRSAQVSSFIHSFPSLLNPASPTAEVLLLLGRFVQYKATSLEKQHKHELLTEPDLGVTIDLINPDTYRIDPNSKFSWRGRLSELFILHNFLKYLKFKCKTSTLNSQFFWTLLMKNCWKRTPCLHLVPKGKNH